MKGERDKIQLLRVRIQLVSWSTVGNKTGTRPRYNSPAFRPHENPASISTRRKMMGVESLLCMVYIFDKICQNGAHSRAFLKGGIASHAAESCRRHPNCYKNRGCLQKNGKILARKRISWSFRRRCPIQTSVVFGLSRSHCKPILAS